MTTIMTVGDSEGERRCDASCHNAAKPRCSCICGGRYHGAGERTVLMQHHYDLLAGVWGEELKRATEAALGRATFEEGGS